MVIHYASRNESLGFAERTRKNLEIIEQAFQQRAEGHVVTQLVLSLLGLVVFPWERGFRQHIRKVRLAMLAKEGWPRWEVKMSKGPCDTLYQLVHHLRNAVTHGSFTFSSDSRNIDDVAIEFEDRESRAQPPKWCARIQAGELRTFCLRFLELVENTVG